jgi:hypothetical protein
MHSSASSATFFISQKYYDHFLYLFIAFAIKIIDAMGTSFNLYRPSGTSVPANVLLFGRAVRLYRCVIPLSKAPSKHKFKTIVLFECLEFFYWLLRLSVEKPHKLNQALLKPQMCSCAVCKLRQNLAPRITFVRSCFLESSIDGVCFTEHFHESLVHML